MSSKIIRTENRSIQNVHFDPLPDAPATRVIGGASRNQAGPDAIKTAASIIEEAELKALQIERDAYQQGYQEGLMAASQETRSSIEIMRQVAEAALEEKWRVINNIENNIVELSIEIAEKIISDHIAVNPEVILGVTRKALMVAADREHLEIRVNPADVDLMKEHKDEILATIDGIQKIEIIGDRRIRQGGCVMQTATGSIDARIQSQLSQIDTSMRGVVRDE